MTDRDKISPLRCYWTPPFGHVYGPYATSYDRECVLCGKKSTRGDGGWHYDLRVNYTGLGEKGEQRALILSEKHQARARRALEKKKKRLNILEEVVKS